MKKVETKNLMKSSVLEFMRNVLKGDRITIDELVSFKADANSFVYEYVRNGVLIKVEQVAL
jgi:hypothetical protein